MAKYLQECPGNNEKVKTLVRQAIMGANRQSLGFYKGAQQELILPSGERLIAEFIPSNVILGGDLSIRVGADEIAGFGFSKDGENPWLSLDGQGVVPLEYQRLGIAKMGMHVIEKVVAGLRGEVAKGLRVLRRNVVKDMVVPRGLPMRERLRRPVVDECWLKLLTKRGYKPADEVSAEVLERVHGVYNSKTGVYGGLIKGEDDCFDRGPIVYPVDPREQLRLVLQKDLRS